MENDAKFTVITEDGTEVEMNILFTYTDEETNKNYVFYYEDKGEEDNEIIVSEYDDEGRLFPVTEEKDYDKLEEVFNQFMEEHEGCECGCCDEDDCDCDDDCCHHNHDA